MTRIIDVPEAGVAVGSGPGADGATSAETSAETFAETSAETFDAFYRASSQRCLRFAYAMCGDVAEAQDLTQEAYVRCWQRWRQVSRYPYPEAWLRTVVTRLVTDRWRWLGVRRRAHQHDRPPEPVPPPSEDGVLLATALRGLPADQRRAIVLHYLLDLSVAQIADETGHGANTVKSWLARGRTNLGKVLGPVAEEAGDVR
ncbi:MAG: SigE family RNA polymerase sigma factor [Catenulispora sp.]|nr:SigE family RNA polymerase sigma factor [Catenulispora sp.]